MNIHLAVSSQAANQERVNEIQKVTPSFREIQKVTLSPQHRFLKGLGKYNNNFICKEVSINRSLYKFPKRI